MSEKHPLVVIDEEPAAKRAKQEDEKEDAEVPKEYQCSVCLDIMHNPVLLAGCGHSACEGCVLALPRKECPLCRTKYKAFIPNVSLRQMLIQEYPDAYDRHAKQLLNGWEIDHCAPDWRVWLPKVMERLDEKQPVTKEDCTAFVKDTTLRLITGPASAAFAFSEGVIRKRDDLVLVLRKYGRVYIFHSLFKELFMGR